ncbi:MAG: DUF4249 domain-containing protein [Bacteroidota bacterium]
MNYLKLFFYSIAFLFMSCEKVIEPGDLPEQDARIVVNSILYTNQSFRVNISVSKSILSGKDYKYIKNAVCGIYENDVLIESLQTDTNGDCRSSFEPKANKKYTIKVSAPNFEGEVIASTTIPDKVRHTSIERYDTLNYNYRFISNDSTQISGSTKFKFKIIDDLTQKNYYSIQSSVLFFDSLNQQMFPQHYKYLINNSNNSNNQNNYDAYTINLDDLTLVNGNEIAVDFELSVNSENSYDVKSMQVYLYLYSLSEDYYKYKTTLNKQASTGVSLFAEPVLVYSNVNNGMGIVAGVNQETVLIYNGILKK